MNESDLRKSWQIIKKIIGRDDNSYSTHRKEYLINNIYTSESKIIANSLNDYFINVGSTLANIINSNVDLLLYIQSNPNIITISEINTIIRNIKNSASGYGELPTSIMKSVSEVYIKPLTYIINKTISLGHFPEELKLARVIPIL